MTGATVAAPGSDASTAAERSKGWRELNTDNNTRT